MKIAHDKIWEIGHKVGLTTVGEDVIGAGKRYYNMCSAKLLTQGRPLKVIAAVCLYIACRVKKKAFLLIDFSDAIQTNVF